MSTNQSLGRIDQKEQQLAFELLSISGDVQSFDTLQKELGVDGEQCTTLRARAEFYKAILDMLENDLEAWETAGRFENGTLAEYTRNSTDPVDAQSLLTVLNSVINMSMETYAQLDAVSIFAKEPISACIKNNMSDTDVEMGLRGFIETAYTRIFCPYDVEKRHIDELFPVIDEWRSLVKPNEIVTDAIRGIDELDELIGYDEDSDNNEISEYFACILEKQIEMTNRGFVSKAYFEHHSDSPAYDYLVTRGIIDGHTKIEVDTDIGEMSAKTQKAIATYERNSWMVYASDVETLAKNIGKDGADHLAVAIGRWCQKGDIKLITPLFREEGGPTCNTALARELVTKVLIQKMEDDKVSFLAHALALPLELVDASASELVGFRLAQRIKHGESINAKEEESAKVSTEKENSADEQTAKTKKSRGGRKFVKISMDEFKQKIEAAFKKDEDLTPRDLTPQVAKDLNKVSFDLENIDWDESLRGELLGFHELGNGLNFLGVQAGGDSQFPVFFIVYWDGKALRGYIPTEGNPWNTDTKSAYGDDEERDLINARKRYPGVFDDVEYVDGGSFDFNVNAIFADIQDRIVER